MSSDFYADQMKPIELEAISKHPTIPLWEVNPGSIHLGIRYTIENNRVWSAFRLKNDSNREFVSTKWKWYPNNDIYKCIYLL
jgi:hypothetical protein